MFCPKSNNILYLPVDSVGDRVRDVECSCGGGDNNADVVVVRALAIDGGDCDACSDVSSGLKETDSDVGFDVGDRDCINVDDSVVNRGFECGLRKDTDCDDNNVDDDDADALSVDDDDDESVVTVVVL